MVCQGGGSAQRIRFGVAWAVKKIEEMWRQKRTKLMEVSVWAGRTRYVQWQLFQCLYIMKNLNVGLGTKLIMEWIIPYNDTCCMMPGRIVNICDGTFSGPMLVPACGGWSLASQNNSAIMALLSRLGWQQCAGRASWFLSVLFVCVCVREKESACDITNKYNLRFMDSN